MSLKPLRVRPRRLRRTAAMRALIRETRLAPSDFVLPQFVVDGEGISEPIASLPGCARQSVDQAITTMERASALGILAFAIFPVVPDALKDATASASLDDDGLVPRALGAMRRSSA